MLTFRFVEVAGYSTYIEVDTKVFLEATLNKLSNAEARLTGSNNNTWIN